jgi:hypothetical protein
MEAASVAGDDGTLGGAAGDEAAEVGACTAVVSHDGHIV